MFYMYYALIGLAVLLGSVYLLKPRAPRKNRDQRRVADPAVNDLDPSLEWMSPNIQNKIPRTADRYLILGAGALGRRIVRALLLRGEKSITVADVSEEALSELEQNDSKLVNKVVVDVRNKSKLIHLCKNIDCIFSTFALIRFYERMDSQLEASYEVNVEGTENLISACVENKVKRLVYTSSSSVTQVCTSEGMSLEMDETSSYCTKTNRHDNYAYTKMLAEKVVIASNGVGGELCTTVVRPCGTILSYNDRYLLDTVLNGSAAPLIDPSFIQDYVPVDNVVFATLLAEEKLRSQGVSGDVAGQVFCITNDDPMSAEDFMDLLHDIDNSVKIIILPSRLLWLMAYIIELLSLTYLKKWIPSSIRLLTPSTLNQVSFAFKSARAKKVLGYFPILSTEAGLKRALRETREKRMIVSIEHDKVQSD